MLKFNPMYGLLSILALAAFSAVVMGQSAAQKIFDTEKQFERAVAEKGINAAFIEFLAPDGVIFTPEQVNGRDAWRMRGPSPALLTWNPIWIEVSANGALGYSIGNGIYRPNGKDDPNASYSHYLSIWSRQPNGEYRAVLDAGINHAKPDAMPTEWRSSSVSGNQTLENSAGDHARNFYAMVESHGTEKAYRSFLADDAFLMREGNLPFVGKKAAMAYLAAAKPKVIFARRKSFIEAGDLAWVANTYTIQDASGPEIERGSFIQVWKLRGGKWQIAADMFIPTFVKSDK